jgi:hypothetical protein
MKILGPFLSIEDPDTFFFMRGFPNLLMPLLDHYEVVLVDDPGGLVRW